MTAAAPDAASGATERNNSASLRRALAILLELGEERGARGATVSELRERLDMNKSTVVRLLAPLVDARLVAQDPDSGRYRLGWRTAQLGQSYLEGIDMRSTMHDVLMELTGATLETSHLVIPDLPEVIYVDKVDTPLAVRMFSRIGSHVPAYCTSVGKAMLAYADPEALERVEEAGMPRRTAATLTRRADLEADLAAIRERGYSIDDIENEDGIRCVGAAVVDGQGRVAGALSVSGPISRVTRERVPELGAAVRASADEVSRRLGARR